VSRIELLSWVGRCIFVSDSSSCELKLNAFDKSLKSFLFLKFEFVFDPTRC
jgi:hypothetical protein